MSFLYVLGLIAQKSSVVQTVKMFKKDVLIQAMFAAYSITQSTMSRFLIGDYNWSVFGQKRIERLQQDETTQLQDGDQVNLDDSLVSHEYAKKIPFLSWLFDHSHKVYLWGMNLVVLQAVLTNGFEYPLFYVIWQKAKEGEGEKTKFDLAREMLLQLRSKVSARLWIAMDRWYLSKEFLVFLMEHQFDWVTKAKRNTALFRKETDIVTGRDRYVPIRPVQLIREVYAQLLIASSAGLVSIAIPNIYIKLPYFVPSKRGKKGMVKKYRFVPIAAVVAMKLKEDEEQMDIADKEEQESPAQYHGAYLIISNRFDDPKGALGAYVKRWRIEVFFRTAKQELGMEQCHSTSENHHHAHMELLFAAETLLNYALFEQNKGKTSDDEVFTHGEVIQGLFHTRCQVRFNHRKGHDRIYIDFDIEATIFARLFERFWPKDLKMKLWSTENDQYIPSTA